MAVVVGMVWSSTLSGCGSSRSVEAYCATMDMYKQRYVSAMSEANGNVAQGDVGGVLGGLAQAVSALADLQKMWDELADVAPDDIRPDVEAVRDSWKEQMDRAKDSAGDPKAALGGALLSSLMASGSWNRVGAYTQEHCGP